MTDREAMKMALDALDAWLVADVTKLPIVIPQTENTVFALRQALAQPWDTSDMAHRSGGLSVEQSQHPLDIYERAYFAGKQDGIDEAFAQHEKKWVGLTDKDFQYQQPAEILTMKYTEALLKERNT